MSKIFLSIIIPCYNEEENLKKGALGSVYNFLKSAKYDWEVIISDDGSTDNSSDLVKNEVKKYRNFRHIINTHGGKPSAIYNGILVARGKYVLFTDMDQSTPIREIEKLLPYIKSGFRVVIGSRGMERKDFPIYRRLGSAVFMTFRRIIILPEIRDTQCGFKLFSKSVVESAFPHLQFFRDKTAPKGWKVTSYDVELLHIIKKMGYKVKEVIVDWSATDVSTTKGGFMGRYIKESQEMFIQILRVRINELRGMYKSIAKDS